MTIEHAPSQENTTLKQRPDTKRVMFESKEFWDINNAEAIADILGYAPDEAFSAALMEFIEKKVAPARIMNFMLTIAKRYFYNKELSAPLLKTQKADDLRKPFYLFSR